MTLLPSSKCRFGTLARRAAGSTVLCLIVGLAASAQGGGESIDIPRLGRAPLFEDFVDMRPPADLAGQMTMVTGFVQRQPSDGQAASQRTEVYLGYDDQNLYAVFVCFDTNPDRIRARLNPRGDTGGDDWIVIVLDTFHDERNAYMFGTSPLGVEWDALWTEGQGARTRPTTRSSTPEPGSRMKVTSCGWPCPSRVFVSRPIRLRPGECSLGGAFRE